MSIEALPQQEIVPEVVSHAALFHEDGTVDEDYLFDNFGIGIEEAMQPVSSSRGSGTLVQMLADDKCPVGRAVSKAYHEDGIAGVTKKFQSLAEWEPTFNVPISEATIVRNHLKKKMSPTS